jgi:hypothetical protein
MKAYEESFHGTLKELDEKRRVEYTLRIPMSPSIHY